MRTYGQGNISWERHSKKKEAEVLFTEEGVERALRQQHPEKYFQLLALQGHQEATQEGQEVQRELRRERVEAL